MRKESAFTEKSTKFLKRELRIKRAKLRHSRCHFRLEINKSKNNENEDGN